MANVQKQTHTLKGKPLGKQWKAVVEDMLMKDGAKQARALLKSGKNGNKDHVIVQKTLRIYVRFPVKSNRLAGDGGVSCACDVSDPTVCICRGACDFPACCDLIVV